MLNSILHKVCVYLKYLLRFGFKRFNEQVKHEYLLPETDVVMPLIAKDLSVAEYSIKSLRSLSLNKINRIYIISPEDAIIQEFCKKNDLIYILENSVLPIPISELIKLVSKKEKVGWFVQQMIKLNSDTIPDLSDNYLVFDADTILLKKQFFFTKSFTILKFSDEFHWLYRMTNKAILGKYNYMPISFIAHHMIFNTAKLRALKEYIEEVHSGRLWYETIFKEAVKRNYFFSEYELYSQFILEQYREQYRIQYWFNLNSKQSMFEKLGQWKNNYYQSVSYHNYKRV